MLKESPITIGITAPDRGGMAGWVFTALAVRLAGGRPLRIRPSRPKTIEQLDGLVLGGGADVHPALYGEERFSAARGRPRARTGLRKLLDTIVYPATWLLRWLDSLSTGSYIDTARDALEIELLESAVKRTLPVLGICRGEQLINVHFGGSLHQSLSGFYVESPETRTIRPRKEILVEPGTVLGSILGARPCRVNGLHRQGVNCLGRGLVVAARDRNHIIQAIEHPAYPFIIGVQWHPEYLPQAPEQRRVFKALIAAARNARQATPPLNNQLIAPGAKAATP